MQKRWGYKGTETALGGLYMWLMRNTTINKNDLDDCIIRYGESNIPGFKVRGKPERDADFVAKKIQKNNRFQDFVNWISQNFERT